MSESIVKYLRQRQEPVSSRELAAAVLHMQKIPDVAARKVIAALLSGNDQVDRVGEDAWVYRNSTVIQTTLPAFLLCRALPAQSARWREWQGFGCVLWSADQVRQPGVITADNPQQFALELQDLFHALKDHSFDFVVLDGFGNQISLLRAAMADLLGEEIEAPILSIRKLAQMLLQISGTQTPAQLAQSFGIHALSEAGMAESMVDLTRLWEHFVARLEENPKFSQVSLSEKILVETVPFDFSLFAFDAEFVRQLPALPGVYLMYDRDARLIYVGKSKNLAQRLSSYFLTGIEVDEKLAMIRTQLFELEYHVTGSELEAVLLEYELIRTLDPPINRQIMVRSRPHRRKARYPRILVLPAVEQNLVRLYLLHPERGLAHFWYGEFSGPDMPGSMQVWPDHPESTALLHQPTKVWEAFQHISSGEIKASLELAELAYSWLSKNEDHVNSIDIRRLDGDEASFQIVDQYYSHILKSSERMIHI